MIRTQALPAYCYRCGALCPTYRLSIAHCKGKHRMPDFTPQEARTLELLIQGMQPKEIAYEMRLRVNSVTARMRRLCDRFGIANGSTVALALAYVEYKAGNRKPRPVQWGPHRS